MKSPAIHITLCCILLMLSLHALADTSYGDPLTDAEVIRISQLIENPDRYVDKLIKIEGLVEDVCPMKGC